MNKRISEFSETSDPFYRYISLDLVNRDFDNFLYQIKDKKIKLSDSKKELVKSFIQDLYYKIDIPSFFNKIIGKINMMMDYGEIDINRNRLTGKIMIGKNIYQLTINNNQSSVSFQFKNNVGTKNIYGSYSKFNDIITINYNEDEKVIYDISVNFDGILYNKSVDQITSKTLINYKDDNTPTMVHKITKVNNYYENINTKETILKSNSLNTNYEKGSYSEIIDDGIYLRNEKLCFKNDEMKDFGYNKYFISHGVYTEDTDVEIDEKQYKKIIKSQNN